MALFNRANLNAFCLLNNCYYKFKTGTLRLKSRISIITNIMQAETEKKTQKASNVKKRLNTFEAEIASRRHQACRSIVVQVLSSNSFNDLLNYCTQFGKVLSMHHYYIKQDNYILVEFKDKESVNEIVSHASFINKDVIAPVKSTVLWFHKGSTKYNPNNNQNPNNNRESMRLFTENNYTCPSEQDIAKLLYEAKSVSGQITDFYETLKLNDLETRLRFHTAHHLEQYFSRLFQNMRVLPFGSSVNGFGRKRCDLDLVLVPDHTAKRDSKSRLIFHTKSIKLDERHGTKEFMGILASTMENFIPGVRNVRRILEARVPIIKFNCEYTHIECDLSTTNLIAIYMSELLNFYGEIDYRVRPLVIVIRKWAKNQEITSDSPGPWITNFSLSLLVLFYLQQKNILPSLTTLISCATDNDARCTENGINCIFLRNVEKLPVEYRHKSNNDSLETLLYGFFEYYSKFDFHTKGICIRRGIPIQKPSHSALHITNPFETMLNVSKNVNIHEVNRILQKLHDALYTLETADTSRSNNWGLMTLMTKLNLYVRHTLKSKRTKENIEDSTEDFSPEISDKYGDSEVDVNQSKRKETV
nr:PREDICTED: poly(A) RNA polymerase, mitochondrial isoform X1 [Linepithema humile]